MKKTIKNIAIYLVIFLSFILLLGGVWVNKTFGSVAYDEVLFHMVYPLNGSDVGSYFIDGVKQILIPSIIIIIILFLIFDVILIKVLKSKIDKSKKTYKYLSLNCIKFVICILLFAYSFICFVNKMDLVNFAKSLFVNSDFIEKNYVDPNEVDIEFPENKRNLIYIFMESIESSYSSTQDGGISNENLIPNLTNFTNDNISFSNTEKLGGALTTSGATWTIASMVSHFSGMPLKMSITGEKFSKSQKFLPGVVTIGDILEKEGYNQEFILGSDAEFGARKALMKQHGSFDIFDYNYAVESGYYNEDDFVWWGYDDSTLYEFAKKELIKLANQDKPFNLTMLTVDTHFEDGYLSDSCTDLKYDDQYSNVISCADSMIYDFVSWIKQQDFYESTTIVIVGDHYSMDVDFFDKYKGNENKRRIYNVYINSALDANNTKNREFSTLDFFPTTLASLGVKIQGDRLGLGTNLFSDNETIIEKYGIDYVSNELNKKSKFYNNKLLLEIKG